MTTRRPAWWYDDLPSVGIDFADPAEVAAYDERQGGDAAELDALLDRLGVGAGSVFVDIGCGTGWLAARAAARGAVVHAVDVSEAMLRAARASAERTGVPPPTTHHAGFLGYVHHGRPAGVVVSMFALHHLPDFWKQEAFVRIHGMLNPGGAFFLRDVAFSFDPAAMVGGIERWIDAMTADGKGRPRAAFETHVRDEFPTYAWILAGMAERAGFVVESSVPDGGAYADFLFRRPAA